MKPKWTARSAARVAGGALSAVLAVGALAFVATAESSIDFGWDVGNTVSEVVSLPEQSYELACATGIETEFADTFQTTLHIQDEPGIEITSVFSLASGEEVNGTRTNAGTQYSSDSPLAVLVHSQVQFSAPSTVVGHVDSEDVRGLVLDECYPARNWSVLHAGSTTVGEAALLTVMNPSKQASEVTLQAWSELGPVEGTPTFTVRAGSYETVNLAAFFPDQERLVIGVDASGPGVVASVRSSRTDGLTPRGLDQQSGSATPAQNVLISGIGSEVSNPALRLLNVGHEEAEVSISLLTPNAIQPLPGGEDVVVDAGAIFQLNLDGMESDFASVLIESSQPVLAFAYGALQGTPDEDGNLLADRVVWVPSEPASSIRAVLPSVEDSTYSLFLSNPSTQTVQVEVGAVPVTLGAGQAINLPVESEDLTIEAQAPIYASVNVVKTAPTGNLISSLPLHDSTARTPTFRLSTTR